MRNSLLLIFLGFSLALFGQTIPHVDPPESCATLADHYSKQFIHYMEKSEHDSIPGLFIEWQSKCGFCEPLQRAIIIYHLKNKTFNDSVLNDSISCYIKIYLSRKNGHYFGNEYYFSYIPVGQDFDIYTDSISKVLIEQYPNRNSVEYLLCELYSNKSDSILIKTRNTRYIRSKIRRYPCTETTQKTKKRYGNITGGNFVLMSGVWIPTSGLTKLGVHPELGFQGGINYPTFSIHLTFMIKFCPTPNEYYAKRVHSNDSIEATTQFAGAYIGFDFGRALFTKGRSEIQAIAGLGFDAFTALDPVEGSGRYEDVRSYNINFGFTYKYYFKSKNLCIGIEPRYNIVDYSLTGVTTLKGNFISLRFSFGHHDSVYKRE